MSTQPAEKRLQRKIKSLQNKLGYSKRQVFGLREYIAELEEMIYTCVDPTGFEGRDEEICSAIIQRITKEEIE